MEKISFGSKTGLMVSKVGFGAIPIMRVSKAEAVSILREAISLGINFIDTANGYTDSEEKIGEAIKGMKREDLIIASKSGAKDKKTFAEHVDLSLKRLGTDYLDIYQFHGVGTPDARDQIFGPNGAMEAMEEAVKAGKIRFPAFSSHSLDMGLELIKTDKFYSVQLPFNYIDTKAAEQAIPLAAKLGMGFLVMKPMGGGLLDNAELVMKYFNDFKTILPIPGIEKIEEIREIVKIVEKNEHLSEDEKKEIERQRSQYTETWCHRCDYCLPCPQDIHIASVLWVESGFRRMPLERAKGMFGSNMDKARSCTECRECVSRCPYNLDIPNLLKDKLKWFDAFAAS